MSTQPRIYLDFNATAPLDLRARTRMTELLSAEAGNPSSIHHEGRLARGVVEGARDRVAALMDRPREQIVFTSGGTEANALGVAALARRATGPRVAWTSPIEHPSLRGPVEALAGKGWEIRRFEVDADGRIQLPPVAPAGLVAVHLVNHELGVVQDVVAISAWAAAAGARLHVDAVQAAGKLPLACAADSLAISAHKLGGPAGIGALAIADDAGLPLVDGGHQERGRRPGTENLLGIAGFGAVAKPFDLGAWAMVASLGDSFERALVRDLGTRIHGMNAFRVGGTINAAFPGARGQSIVIALDLAGVSVSTGAACTSGSVQPSPVLLGLGLPPDQAREAVRFSLGRTTTRDELERVLELLPPIVARARAGTS